jgi:thioredoxin reductase
VPGFAECWGKSVIHCPFCHGYEVADQPTGIWANGDDASHLVQLLLNWSRDLTLFTNGPATFGDDVHQLLRTHNVPLEETPVAELLHQDSQLEALRLTDGCTLPLPVLYARVPARQASTLGQQLGCELTEQQFLRVDAMQRTTVPGVFAAGDCCNPMAQLAQAIAAGNLAGAMLSRELIFGSP